MARPVSLRGNTFASRRVARTALQPDCGLFSTQHFKGRVRTGLCLLGHEIEKILAFFLEQAYSVFQRFYR